MFGSPSKKGRRSGGFEYVEDTIRGRIVGWMNEILKQISSPFEFVDQQIEIRYPDGRTLKFPDIVVWEKKGTKAACLIEFKPPLGWTHDLILNDAQPKAINASPQIPYFGTWNTNEFFLWKTFDPEAISLIDRRKARYEVVKIRSLREVDRPEVELEIKDFLSKFLKDLEEIYYERIEIPKIPIDEFFIYNLRSVVDAFGFTLAEHIKYEYRKRQSFRNDLNGWFVEQSWTPPTTDEDFERTSRQFLYLLIDKILFYNTLRISYKKLKPIQVAEGIQKGDSLKKELQKYFAEAEKVTGDYETVFGVNFIETIPIPDEIVPNFRTFINGFSKHDFSKLGFKDIGRIYDSLIPTNERHKLGQYFTRDDVVDLINTFSIRNADQVIADFGCGAGTFLVRGYARLKTLDSGKEHKDLLGQLWGVDISKFPAHLSVINLAVRDLREIENYPRVICKDFFETFATQDSSKLKYWMDISDRIETLAKKRKKVYVPFMDAVVGNPPYTRQEELEDYIPEYKQKLETVLKHDWGKEIELGRRAGIHAYFFLHGLKFLRNGGRFGYITSNSWLDVDYGKYLQEFFLKKFKIVAIIESKVERWFEEADINTAIAILERCYSINNNEDEKLKKERDENLVKFVQILVPLKDLVPITDDEDKRFKAIEKLVELIESTDKLYEDDKIRICPKKQKELWDDGLDEERKYVGSKWGKYVRAPDIFFKILEKGEDLFIPLKKVAKIKRGITTGVNEFFYLTEDEIRDWGIEKEFWMHHENGKWVPNYVIKGPRECPSITVNPGELKYRVLMIHKDKEELKKTNVLKYIKWGEERAFHNNPTCTSRQRWYDLGEKERGEILWLKNAWRRLPVLYNSKNAYADCRFYEISVLEKKQSKVISALLNSTVSILFAELVGRSVLGLGARDIMTYECSNILIIDPLKIKKTEANLLEKAFNKLSQRETKEIFEEVKMQDRQELDNIIFDILKLTKKERENVYLAVVDLVNSRIEKAQSAKKRKKVKGPDPEVLAEGVIREIDTSKLKVFPTDYIGKCECRVVKVPEGLPEIGSDLHGFFVKVSGERLTCSSPQEAEYLYYAILNGFTEIKIPKETDIFKKSLREYKTAHKDIEKKITQNLERYIPDKKLRESVRLIVWQKLWQK